MAVEQSHFCGQQDGIFVVLWGMVPGCQKRF